MKYDLSKLPSIKSNKLNLFAIIFIILVIFISIFSGFVVQYPPDEQLFEGLTMQGAPLAPNKDFILGTDLLGRDLFSRIVYGSRTSLLIGLIANSISVILIPSLIASRAHASIVSKSAVTIFITNNPSELIVLQAL